jgi:hypothetical protein
MVASIARGKCRKAITTIEWNSSEGRFPLHPVESKASRPGVIDTSARRSTWLRRRS